MVATGPGQGLLPASLFHTMKYEWRSKSLSQKGLGNDVMSRALNQISKSPFTRRIEGGKLPRRFTQPTFIMYIGRKDPVEHVSHFN